MIALLIEAGLLIALFVNYILFHQWHSLLLAGCLAGMVALAFSRDGIVKDLQLLATQPKLWLRQLWEEWGQPLIVAVILAVIIRTFFFGPYKIPTESMVPTFLVGDRIFVDKISYRFREPERGEIIVFKYPLDEKKDFVKRLVGLPGDTVEIRDGRLLINGKLMEEEPFSKFYYYNRDDWQFGRHGQTIHVPENFLFTLGDNSAKSSDSRSWGFVARKNLVGRALCIWWPPKRVKIVK